MERNVEIVTEEGDWVEEIGKERIERVVFFKDSWGWKGLVEME